jgi:hypothetical protein
LNDAANAFYSEKQAQEAAVAMATQETAKTKAALSNLVELMEQIGDLPAATAAQAPIDRAGKEPVKNKVDEIVNRMGAARKILR